MRNYIPFLKLKSNEIMAVGSLADDIKSEITPFFDFARKDGMTEKIFKDTAVRLERSVSKNLKGISSFYLDNFDINTGFTINGEDNYKYLMGVFGEHSFIPVVGLDRSDSHLDAVYQLKVSDGLLSDTLAIRLTQEDLESFAVTDIEIEDLLTDLLIEFEHIDLILDCRVCPNLDAAKIGTKLAQFIFDFTDKYEAKRIVIAGSSITPSIGDMLDTEDNGVFERNELKIFWETQSQVGDLDNLFLGDYGVVSPSYSDVAIPGYALTSIMTPKIIYSYGDSHFVIRGGALKTHPRGNLQYNDFSQLVVSQAFYRGKAFSFGDNFLDEKSNNIGASVTPSSILKPTINAHITYMHKQY